jgi:hypothetical protein
MKMARGRIPHLLLFQLIREDRQFHLPSDDFCVLDVRSERLPLCLKQKLGRPLERSAENPKWLNSFPAPCCYECISPGQLIGIEKYFTAPASIDRKDKLHEINITGFLQRKACSGFLRQLVKGNCELPLRAV